MPAFASTVRQQEWWISSLHVSQAWQTSKGSGVTIAVLADGVVASQADLTGSVKSGPDFTRSGRTASGRQYGLVGTGIASLIAGHGHGQQDANGIVGIAPDARILSVRVTLSPADPLWSNRAVTSRLPAAIAAGIRYAVKHGASVIELPADPGIPEANGGGGAVTAAGGSAAEQAAIGYAFRHNAVLVAPAGDNAKAGDAVNYPAAYRGVIAVGAFGSRFNKAPYSSRRPYVTLTAAGEGIVAAAPSGYQAMNSTWAASAVVAGIAALVRSEFPNLTATQVGQALTGGTVFRPVGGMQDGSGHGTADARGALRQAATMSPPHAQLAALGAVARSRPTPPAVSSSASVVARDLLRDGAYAAGALIVLLVLITAYSSVRRRRDRRAALAAAADRERRNQQRYGYEPMPADPLLEPFAPQHARQAGSAGSASDVSSPSRATSGPAIGTTRSGLPTRSVPPAHSALPGRSALPARSAIPAPSAHRAPSSLFGRPTLTARSAPPARTSPSGITALPAGSEFPARAVPAARSDPGSGPVAGADPRWATGPAPATGPASGAAPASGTGAELGPGFGSDSRPVFGAGPRLAAVPDPRPTVQHTPVSGSPPWEPAPQPTTDFPWAAVPASPAGASRPGSLGAPRVPAEAAWIPAPAKVSAAPGSLFDPISRDPADLQAGLPAIPQSDGAGPSRTDTASRPIYVWNPAASTDSFPAVDPDQG